MHIVPWVHVVPEQGALPVDLLLPVTGRTYVARLDGREMRDTDTVFQQFYDGLRPPEYFGWNWEALSDCLRDLKWQSVAPLVRRDGNHRSDAALAQVVANGV